MERTPLRLVAGGQSQLQGQPQPAARPRIGDILRARGLVSQTEIDAALLLHQQGDIRLGEALCAEGILQPSGLLLALEEQWGARHVNLSVTPPDSNLVSRIGMMTCLADATVPWRRIGSATVVVTEDPHGFNARRERYEQALGPVMMALAAPGEVAQAISKSHRFALMHRAEARVPLALSCRAWRADAFRIGGTIVGLAIATAALFAFSYLLVALLAIAVISLLAITVLKAAAAIAQARPEPPSADIHDLRDHAQPGRLPVISVLVPLYKEHRIAAHLIRRLEELDYPRSLLDVCLVAEEDDEITQATLSETELPRWMRVMIVPDGSVKTKPRALNFALDFCRGSIIGVYDAEDAPAPDQLRRVVERFAHAGPQVACLQGCLDFYNTKLNWMSRCFTMEYATWFQVMLPGVARLGLVVPLGGTTLFFRRRVLDELGGWDAHNVTEDADLGIRLARAGYRTEILQTITQEEANSDPWPWVKQRSRWLKGYAMTYAVHMRNPVHLWRDLGAWRFWGVQVMFLGTLIQFALAPLLWSMWLIPLGLPHPVSASLPGPVLTAVAIMFTISELVSLSMAVRALHRTQRLRLCPWVLTLPVYFALATMAVYKALIEMFHCPFYWDKTQHGGFGAAAEHTAQTPQATKKSPPPKSISA